VIYLCQRLLAVIGDYDHGRPSAVPSILFEPPSVREGQAQFDEKRLADIQPRSYTTPMISICELSDNLGIYRAAGNQQTPGINVALIVTISSGSW
jgi:hypothetical protein